MTRHGLGMQQCPVAEENIPHPGKLAYTGAHGIPDHLLSMAYRTAGERLLFDTTTPPEEALAIYTVENELARLLGEQPQDLPELPSRKPSRYVPAAALAGIALRFVEDDDRDAKFKHELTRHRGKRDADDPLVDVVKDIRATFRSHKKELIAPDSPERGRIRAWRSAYNREFVRDTSRYSTKRPVPSGMVLSGVDAPEETAHALLMVASGMDGQPKLRRASEDTRLEIAHLLGPAAIRRLYLGLTDFRRKPLRHTNSAK